MDPFEVDDRNKRSKCKIIKMEDNYYNDSNTPQLETQQIESQHTHPQRESILSRNIQRQLISYHHRKTTSEKVQMRDACTYADIAENIYRPVVQSGKGVVSMQEFLGRVPVVTALQTERIRDRKLICRDQPRTKSSVKHQSQLFSSRIQNEKAPIQNEAIANQEMGNEEFVENLERNSQASLSINQPHQQKIKILFSAASQLSNQNTDEGGTETFHYRLDNNNQIALNYKINKGDQKAYPQKQLLIQQQQPPFRQPITPLKYFNKRMQTSSTAKYQDQSQNQFQKFLLDQSLSGSASVGHQRSLTKENIQGKIRQSEAQISDTSQSQSHGYSQQQIFYQNYQKISSKPFQYENANKDQSQGERVASRGRGEQVLKISSIQKSQIPIDLEPTQPLLQPVQLKSGQINQIINNRVNLNTTDSRQQPFANVSFGVTRVPSLQLTKRQFPTSSEDAHFPKQVNFYNNGINNKSQANLQNQSNKSILGDSPNRIPSHHQHFPLTERKSEIQELQGSNTVNNQGKSTQMITQQQQQPQSQSHILERKRNSQRGRMKSEDLSSLRRNIFQAKQDSKGDYIYDPSAKETGEGTGEQAKIPSTLEAVMQQQTFYKPQKRSESEAKRNIKFQKSILNQRSLMDQKAFQRVEDYQVPQQYLVQKQSDKFTPDLVNKGQSLQAINIKKDEAQSQRNISQFSLHSHQQQSNAAAINLNISQARRDQVTHSLTKEDGQQQNFQQNGQMGGNGQIRKELKRSSNSTNSLPVISQRPHQSRNFNQEISNSKNSLQRRSQYESSTHRNNNDDKISVPLGNIRLQQAWLSSQQQRQTADYVRNKKLFSQELASSCLDDQREDKEAEYSYLELSFGEGSPVRRRSSISSQADRIKHRDLQEVKDLVENKRSGVNTSQKRKEQEKGEKSSSMQQKFSIDLGQNKGKKLTDPSPEQQRMYENSIAQKFFPQNLSGEENRDGNAQVMQDKNLMNETSTFLVTKGTGVVKQYVHDQDVQTLPDNGLDLGQDSIMQLLTDRGPQRASGEFIYFNEMVNEKQSSQLAPSRYKLPITNKRLKTLFGIPKNKSSSTSVQKIVDPSQLAPQNNELLQNNAIQLQSSQSSSISKFLQGVQQTKQNQAKNPEDKLKKSENLSFVVKMRQNNSNQKNGSGGQSSNQNSQSGSPPQKHLNLNDKLQQQISGGKNYQKFISNSRINHSRNMTTSSTTVSAGVLNNESLSQRTYIQQNVQRNIFQSHQESNINARGTEKIEQHDVLDSNSLTTQQKLDLLEKIQQRTNLKSQGKPPAVRVIHKRSNTETGLSGVSSRLENYHQEFTAEELRIEDKQPAQIRVPLYNYIQQNQTIGNLSQSLSYESENSQSLRQNLNELQDEILIDSLKHRELININQYVDLKRNRINSHEFSSLKKFNAMSEGLPQLTQQQQLIFSLQPTLQSSFEPNYSVQSILPTIMETKIHHEQSAQKSKQKANLSLGLTASEMQAASATQQLYLMEQNNKKVQRAISDDLQVGNNKFEKY